MSEPTPPAEGGLADAVEGIESAWAELRSHLTLREGFWLGYLFTSDPRLVRELETRSADFLSGSGRGVRTFRAEVPGRLIDAIPWLLDGCEDDLGLVWVTGGGHPDGEWLAGWVSLLRRLNEHRDTLRHVLPTGLVFVGPPDLLAVAREAPDLWDFRAMVIMDPSMRIQPGRARLSRAAAPRMPPSDDERDFAELALQPPVEPSPEVARLLQQANRVSQSGPSGALDAARTAVKAARTAEDKTLARGYLAQALGRMGDWVTAAHSANAALDAGRPLGLGLTRTLLTILGKHPDRDQALKARLRDLAISRQLLSERGENPQTLRDLSVSLQSVGAVSEARGDLHAALDAYTEALAIYERLEERYGESSADAKRLADLRASVERLRRALGEG